MSVETRFESYNEATVIQSELTGQSEVFYYHDIHTGKIIIVRSLADNKGAVVHVVEDFSGKASDLTTQDVANLSTPDNLHAELFPWFSTTLPVHLDSGEDVNLVMQHRPDIIVLQAFRSRADLD